MTMDAITIPTAARTLAIAGLAALLAAPACARAGALDLQGMQVPVASIKHAFFFLGTGAGYAESLVSYLESAKKEGKIGNKIAMINIADGFGVELANATRKAAKQHGFELVYDKSYPIGTQDMTPLLTEIKSKNADVFIAYSYPPDTMLITEQSRINALNPKVMFTGVGTQFPMFKAKFGAATEGIMAPGGVDFDAPAIKDYFKRHKESAGYEPDRVDQQRVFRVLQQADDVAVQLQRLGQHQLPGQPELQ